MASASHLAKEAKVLYKENDRILEKETDEDFRKWEDNQYCQDVTELIISFSIIPVKTSAAFLTEVGKQSSDSFGEPTRPRIAILGNKSKAEISQYLTSSYTKK